MKTSCERLSKARHLISAALAVVLVILAANTLQAALITHSGDLLTVSADNKLRSYSFTGTPSQTLQINIAALPGVLGLGLAQGVSVINDRVFIGLVSANALFTSRVVEVDPLTGNVINTLFTFSHGITALGDDGTNLLVLDSVNIPLKTYTYDTSGTLVSTVTPVKPANLNYHAEGIAGDGQSVFMAVAFSNPLPQPPNGNVLLTPIVTNTSTGSLVGYFNTNIAGNDALGGLAYNPNDQTLWVASKNIYQHYNQQGTLLSSFLGDGSAVNGIAVIAPSAVPEPLSLTFWGVGALGCTVGAYRRRRAASPS